MIRRALLVGVLAAAVFAPAAQARPSIVVQAAATAINEVEVMNVQFECSAANAGAALVYLRRCSFGPIYASTGGCFECYDVPVASGGGNLAVGLPYDLCVTAQTYTATGTQTVSKCAPFSYLTNTATIAG
ncbi:MAG: hypothetical protein QOG77_1136 [Solirubrobacteraceae bacterium]|jgi:hypothetical protein|nr:hypothetical protein [Solirubrobacteraceae bacterium]